VAVGSGEVVHGHFVTGVPVTTASILLKVGGAGVNAYYEKIIPYLSIVAHMEIVVAVVALAETAVRLMVPVKAGEAAYPVVALNVVLSSSVRSATTVLVSSKYA
jgi:hypothetical protein